MMEKFQKMGWKNIYNKWKGFEWDISLCEGHNIKQILSKLKLKKMENQK